MRKQVIFGLFVALLLATGCQKLKVENTLKDVMPGELREVEITAPTYEQRVTVTIASTKGAVGAYLVSQANLAAAKKALDVPKKEPASDLVIATRTGEGTFSFEATIPAKTGYFLVIRNSSKTTDVTYSVIGK